MKVEGAMARGRQAGRMGTGAGRALERYGRFMNEVRDFTGVSEAEGVDVRAAVDEVLGLLRARLTPREFDHLCAQLPAILRSRVNDLPRVELVARHYHARDLVRRMADHYFAGDELRAEEFVRGVFVIVRRHVSDGEVNDVISQLPADFRRLIGVSYGQEPIGGAPL